MKKRVFQNLLAKSALCLAIAFSLIVSQIEASNGYDADFDARNDPYYDTDNENRSYVGPRANGNGNRVYVDPRANGGPPYYDSPGDSNYDSVNTPYANSCNEPCTGAPCVNYGECSPCEPCSADCAPPCIPCCDPCFSPCCAIPCCDPCVPCGQWYISAEALYWKPSHNPIYVARRSDPFTGADPGRREDVYLTGRHHIGGRVRVGYEICNCFVDASYLYLCTSDHASKDRGDFERMLPAGIGPNPQPGPEVSNSVSSRAKFLYQNVDIRGGKLFCLQNCATAFAYANARWVNTQFHNRLDAVLNQAAPNSYFLRQSSSFNGGGIGAGLGAHWSFFRNFGVNGNAGLMAIFGQTSMLKYRQHDDAALNLTEVFLTKSQNWLHILPAVDMRVAFDYTLRCGCILLTGEVGYEVNYYFNMLRYYSEDIPTEDGSERIPLFTPQSIGFSGPFASLTVQF